MPDQIVNSELALAKLEHDHQLARLGLQGTLWGAWAALIAIVAIAAIQVATGRYVLEGVPSRMWLEIGMARSPVT
jgi:hypothetical protein